MGIVILLIVLVLLFGGGGFSYPRWGSAYPAWGGGLLWLLCAVALIYLIITLLRGGHY